MVCWFSLSLLPSKRLLKKHAACCNFPGLSLSNSTSSPSSHSYSATSFVNACLWAVAMSPLLLRVFIYIIAEGFVCFCKKLVSDIFRKRGIVF